VGSLQYTNIYDRLRQVFAAASAQFISVSPDSVSTATPLAQNADIHRSLR